MNFRADKLRALNSLEAIRARAEKERKIIFRTNVNVCVTLITPQYAKITYKRRIVALFQWNEIRCYPMRKWPITKEIVNAILPDDLYIISLDGKWYLEEVLPHGTRRQVCGSVIGIEKGKLKFNLP